MNYITTKQAARRWNISERRVRSFCIEGRIGAVKLGKSWLIPKNAKYPGLPTGGYRRHRSSP